MGGNMQIVETSLGTTILWTEATAGGNALYSVSFRDGSWTEPVQISDNNRILSNISAVCYNGKLTGVCNAIDLHFDSSTGAYTQGETNLSFFQANAFSDLVLNYVLPVDECALERNRDAVLSVSVTNQGTTDIRKITFSISDTLGTEMEQTISVDLPSGDSQILDLTYHVPETYAATTVTISAKTEESDLDPEDNVITLELGKPDLKLVDADVEYLEDAYLIKAYVENGSQVDAEKVTLELRMDAEDSAPFLMKEVALIPSDNYTVVHVIVPAEAFYFDRNGLAYVFMTLNTKGVDATEGDNTALLLVEETVAESKPAAGMKGDLDLDGDVDSDDLTLLARHVARIQSVEGQALKNADVNSDDKVDSDDLTRHARYVARIISDWDQE